MKFNWSSRNQDRGRKKRLKRTGGLGGVEEEVEVWDRV